MSRQRRDRGACPATPRSGEMSRRSRDRGAAPSLPAPGRCHGKAVTEGPPTLSLARHPSRNGREWLSDITDPASRSVKTTSQRLISQIPLMNMHHLSPHRGDVTAKPGQRGLPTLSLARHPSRNGREWCSDITDPALQCVTTVLKRLLSRYH